MIVAVRYEYPVVFNGKRQPYSASMLPIQMVDDGRGIANRDQRDTRKHVTKILMILNYLESLPVFPVVD